MSVNLSFFHLDGPDDNKMTLWGSETGREGFSGNWKYAVSESYPAVNLTWYNGSTEFTPDSKAVVTNTNVSLTFKTTYINAVYRALFYFYILLLKIKRIWDNKPLQMPTALSYVL